MMNKMEAAIHTISETCQGISKMLAIHEERIEATYKTDTLILERIKEMEKRNTEDHNRVISRIDDIEDQIDGLVKFRWLVGGAVILIVFVFSQQQVHIMDYLPKPQPNAIVKPVK